jgi:hypothetical protein
MYVVINAKIFLEQESVMSLPEITTCQSVQQLLFEKGGASWFKDNVSESLVTMRQIRSLYFVSNCLFVISWKVKTVIIFEYYCRFGMLRRGVL